MNILFLNGGPRKNGVTTTLLKVMQENIREEHTVEWYDTYKLNIKPCIGCLKCRPDKECIMPRDDGHLMGEKINWCNMLIVSSPTYWGNITSSLKEVFDRNVPVFEYVEVEPNPHIPRPKQKGKQAIIVTASAAPVIYNLLPSQSGGTVRAIKTVLNAGGIRTRKIINVPSSWNFDQKKEKYLRKAAKVAKAI